MGFSPSTTVADSEYLLTRLTTEASLAANARTKQAAAAHHTIANSYLGRLFSVQGTISPYAKHADHLVPLIARNINELADLRFADLTSVSESDELNRILDTIP